MRRLLAAGLLLAGFTQAIQVYLSPPPPLPPSLTPEHGVLALSRHLGLEYLDSAAGYAEFYSEEESFVGQGPQNAILLTINEEDAQDVLPESMWPSFSLPDEQIVTSLSSVISTYLHRAPRIYTSIFTALSMPPRVVPRTLDLFSVSSPATDLFLSEMSTLTTFIDEPTSSKFTALELQGLAALADTYGRSSEQYALAARTTRAFLQSALASSAGSSDGSSDGVPLRLALLTFPTPRTHQQRADTQSAPQEQPSQTPFPVPTPNPQEPIGSVSTCHASSEVCTNATNTCSGRGQCVQASKAGRTCFVCACRTIVNDKGKNETWVGESCERKDISGPFVLLAGTAIALILLIAGSISLLYTAGEQKLPSTLLAGAARKT